MVASVGTQVCNTVFSKSFCDKLAGTLGNFGAWKALAVTAVVGFAIIKVCSRSNSSQEQRSLAGRAASASGDGFKSHDDSLPTVPINLKISRRLRELNQPNPEECQALQQLIQKGVTPPGLTLPTLLEFIESANSASVFKQLLSSNTLIQELPALIKGMLSNPPNVEEIRQAYRIFAIFFIRRFKSAEKQHFNLIQERWSQLSEAARLYENWSSKTPEEQKRVFVEVFEKHCQNEPESSDRLQITDPRNEIIGEMRGSAFAWVFKRSKEELKQTLIDGIPILHWAIINRNYELLVKLISRGFTIEDIRMIEEKSLLHQIQEMEKRKPSFPFLMLDEGLLLQTQSILGNPPEEAALEDAKRTAGVFGVETLKVLPHLLGSELKLEQEEEQTHGAEPEKPTYTITDPTGATTKIGKFPRITEIGTDEEESVVKCEWDSAFNWVLEKSKEELEQTQIDGMPLLPWAVIHDEKTLIAKLIHRGFSLEDLEKEKGNLLQYHVQNFECEYQSQISSNEQTKRFIELVKELISNPPERKETERVGRVAAIIYAATLKNFAEAPLQRCERNWEQLTDIANLYSSDES